MGYWHGSGTLGVTVTRDFDCDYFDGGAEGCTGSWTEDFETDDWGNIEQETTCPVCNTKFTYKEERE